MTPELALLAGELDSSREDERASSSLSAFVQHRGPRASLTTDVYILVVTRHSTARGEDRGMHSNYILLLHQVPRAGSRGFVNLVTELKLLSLCVIRTNFNIPTSAAVCVVTVMLRYVLHRFFVLPVPRGHNQNYV